jgi:hypothetical protein
MYAASSELPPTELWASHGAKHFISISFLNQGVGMLPFSDEETKA